MFELLANLMEPRSLPGFSRANWQSNIRRHVTVHPEYRTMAPWMGRETSDLVYDDTVGALTGCLIDHGFLMRGDWAGQRPQYFLEVKTTTSSCETPFFMSKAQYRRVSFSFPSVEDIYEGTGITMLTAEPLDARKYRRRGKQKYCLRDIPSLQPWPGQHGPQDLPRPGGIEGIGELEVYC